MNTRLVSCVALLLFVSPLMAETNDEARIRIAMAMQRARQSAAESQRTSLTEEAQPFRWTTETPGQLTLWRGEVQVGAFRLADRQYLACAGGQWTAGACPAELPKEASAASRPFAESSEGNRTPVRTAADSSLSSRAEAPSRARTFTNVRPAAFVGFTTTSRGCVGRT